MWIGLYHDYTAFKWTDGSQFDYSNWDIHSMQPDESSQGSYSVVSKTGSYHDYMWWDDPNWYDNIFVCKKPINTNSINEPNT